MRIAAYARFSSDLQREASLEDQLRNCRKRCAHEGWPEPEVFADSAISGARLDRPAYRHLLSELHRFDVILVDDLTRFGRDKEEIGQAVKRMTFAGVRLIGVSDGVDTARRGHKVDVGLRGLMSELYLDDLADKTHRGLTGRALAGASGGGLPYGYRITSTGFRAIDEVQAQVVRRVFAEYLAGQSPRAIAAGLNRDGIPSPRGSSWALSVIYGDARRGIGILANPIYTGRQVWNRSHWVKHPESGRRVRKERPESEWITVEKPELAIIDAATWSQAQARISGRHRDTGRKGRPNHYLLSGLLRCPDCSGPMVMVDRYRYGCAAAKDRGTCENRLRIPRRPAEHALLEDVRARFLTEAGFQEFQREAAAAFKRQAPTLDKLQRELAEAEKVRENVMAAIRAGILTPSTRAELTAAEGRVDAAREALAVMKSLQPAQLLPRAREVWEGIVETLGDYTRDIRAARDVLRQLLGESLTARKENGVLFAESTPELCQINVVAGAGFGRYLTRPSRPGRYSLGAE